MAQGGYTFGCAAFPFSLSLLVALARSASVGLVVSTFVVAYSLYFSNEVDESARSIRRERDNEK